MNYLFNLVRQAFADNKPWVRFSIEWFVLSALAGAVLFLFRPELLEQIAQMFSERFGADPALDLNLALAIFINNLFASLIAIIGGVLFGLISFLALVANGFLIGFVVMSMFFIGDSWTFGLLVLAVGLLPHAIFELPAFLLSSSLGMRWGVGWMSQPSGQKWIIWKQDAVRAAQGFAVILILLIIAGLVEVFVSGMLVDKL